MIMSKIDGLTRDWAFLTGKWTFLSSTWQDAVRSDFERRYMHMLRVQVDRTLQAMRLLDDEVDAARRVMFHCRHYR